MKASARARAKAAEHPSPRMLQALAALTVATCLVAASVAYGQTSSGTEPKLPGASGSQAQQMPSDERNPGGSPNGSQQGGTGVIHPPAAVDPGMKRVAPPSQQAFPMPVVPPPGTPGGNPNVIAK